MKNYEIRFVCGTITQYGKSVDANVFTRFEIGLAKAFGGYTCTVGHGGFIMLDGHLQTEYVKIYDVAIPSGTLVGMVESMGRQLATMADQACVYFRDITGQVHLLVP